MCLAAMQEHTGAFEHVPEHLKVKMKEKYLNNNLPNR
jgi:hypothetical protein